MNRPDKDGPADGADGRLRRLEAALRAGLSRLRSSWVGGAVFVAACLVGLAYVHYLETQGGQLLLHREMAARAAALASGRGWVLPDANQLPALREFVEHRAEHFDPALLPEDPPQTWNSVERYHVYLSLAAGVVWWIFGISWHNLVVLAALLLGLSGLAMYLMCRIALPRWLSALGALIFVCAPALLGQLHNVRDFGKTPFVAFAVCLMVWLLGRSWPRRRFWALSGLLGAVIGVGMGFRQDLSVCLLPALVVVLLFSLGQRMRDRALAAVLVVAGFVALGAPMLGVMEGGSNPYHPIMMGWGSDSRAALGLEAPAYEQLTGRCDNSVYAAVTAYMDRQGVENQDYNRPELVRYIRTWLIDVALFTPADVLIRWYGAVLWVLGNGQAHQVPFEPGMLSFGWLETVYNAVARLLLPFRLLGLALVLGAVASRNWRSAFGLGFLVLFFGGYISIAFEYRHAFHLCFAPIVIWLCVFYAAGRLALGAARNKDARAGFFRAITLRTRPARRALGFVVLACLLLGGGLQASRWYQISNMEGFFRERDAAELKALPVQRTTHAGWTFLESTRPIQFQKPEDALCSIAVMACRSALLPMAPPVFWPFLLERPARTYRLPPPRRCEYLVAELAPCKRERLMLIAFDDTVKATNHTQVVVVPPCHTAGAKSVRYFFPVYYSADPLLKPPGEHYFHYPWGLFRGVALPIEQGGQLKGLYRVKRPEAFRLHFNVALPDVWHDEPLYHRLARPPERARRWFRHRSPRGWCHSGLDYRADGKLGDAVAAFRAAHVLAPDDAWFSLELADTLMLQGKPLLAADAYRWAIDAASHEHHFYNWAETGLVNGLPEEQRVAWWDRLTKDTPDNPTAWLFLAREYERQQDFDAALAALNQGLAAGLPETNEDLLRVRDAIEARDTGVESRAPRNESPAER